MLKRCLRCTCVLVVLLPSLPVVADDETHLGRAILESGRASLHGSIAAGHGLAASGQATLAVSAVPLSLSGAALTSVGRVSSSAAVAMQRAASAPVGAPLEISDEYLITVPPDQALNPHP